MSKCMGSLRYIYNYPFQVVQVGCDEKENMRISLEGGHESGLLRRIHVSIRTWRTPELIVHMVGIVVSIGFF